MDDTFRTRLPGGQPILPRPLTWRDPRRMFIEERDDAQEAQEFRENFFELTEPAQPWRCEQCGTGYPCICRVD